MWEPNNSIVVIWRIPIVSYWGTQHTIVHTFAIKDPSTLTKASLILDVRLGTDTHRHQNKRYVHVWLHSLIWDVQGMKTCQCSTTNQRRLPLCRTFRWRRALKPALITAIFSPFKPQIPPNLIMKCSQPYDSWPHATHVSVTEFS